MYLQRLGIPTAQQEVDFREPFHDQGQAGNFRQVEPLRHQELGQSRQQEPGPPRQQEPEPLKQQEPSRQQVSDPSRQDTMGYRY